jgi:hypothetical protein
MMILSQYHIFELDTINIYSVVEKREEGGQSQSREREKIRKEPE